MTRRTRRASRWSAVVTVVVVFIAMTAQAAFAPSVAREQSATGGTLTVSVAPNGSGNRFSIDATHVLPGDTIDRVVDVTYNGTIAISALRLTTTATTTSVMDTDAT